MSTTAFPLRGLTRLVMFLGAFVAALNVARAEDTPAGTLAFSVPVPAGKLTLKEVHDIALKAAVARRWTAKQDSENRVGFYLSSHKQEATVTFVLTDTMVLAYCEGFITDGRGTRKGPGQPTKWLNYLKEDITRDVTNAIVLGKK